MRDGLLEEKKQVAIENIATMFFSTALVIGLAIIFKSIHCLWGLLLLLNLKFWKESDGDD